MGIKEWKSREKKLKESLDIKSKIKMKKDEGGTMKKKERKKTR